MFRKRKVETKIRKRSIDSLFVFSKKGKRRSASSVFSVARKRTKKSNFKFQIKNFKSSLKDKISNLKLPKFRFRNLTLKRSTALITLVATVATVYFQFIPSSQGASYTWNQTSWTSQTANNPVHLTNATGWSEYSAKDANISFVNSGADVQLSTSSYTATDDGVFSTTGSATGGDFDNGTNTNTQVVGVDAAASVQINTGNASQTKTSDTDFSGGTHSGTVISGTGDPASITLPTLTATNVTHTADTDFTGTHTSTEVSGTGDTASVQLQAAQTSGTYESQTIDFGAAGASADYQSVNVSQEGGSGNVVMARGANANGQLGNGNTTASWSSSVQTLNIADVTTVSAGDSHSLALKSDGTVWAWGLNTNGRLGDNTTTQSTTPVQVKDTAGTGWLTDIVSIAAGSAHSLALKSDGTVWAWGLNTNGQLGDNSVTQRLTPVQVKDTAGTGWLTDIVSIEAGSLYSLALKSDGTVWAWGLNSSYQLGDNTATQRNTPVQVLGYGGVGFLNDVVSITAGYNSSFATKSDGTVWGWGVNEYYKLGDGTNYTRATPVQAKGAGGVGFLTDVIMAVAGQYHTSVLKSDGTVWSWGYGGNGQLGDGTYVDKTNPVQVKGAGGVGFLTGVIVISKTDNGMRILKSDGTVWWWGYDGGVGNSNVPVQYSDLTNIVAIATRGGSGHLLAVKGGARFQIASKDADSGWVAGDYKPLFRQSGSGRRAIAPNSIDSKRYVRYKATLLANNGTYTPKINSLSINVRNIGNFTSGVIDLGGVRQFTSKNFSFGTTIPAEIAGNRVQLQLSRDGVSWHGPGGSSGYYDSAFCSVSTGTYTCPITDATATILNGTSNLYYKVFLNTTLIAYLPTFDSATFNYHNNESGTFESATIDLGGGVNFSNIDIDQSAGTGAVNMAWGYNYYGSLGDNTTAQRNTPVQTSGLSDIKAISGSYQHSLALKSDGTVWAWGDNGQGQLGDNTVTQRNAPVQVKGVGGTGWLTDATAIAAGSSHSLALKSDGTVWAWGSNGNGQLGDNTTTQRLTPVQVKGVGGTGWLTDVAAIALGGSHSLALKSDGTVWAWGWNSAGRLGDNTTTSRSAPVQVKGVGGSGYLTDVVAIAGGSAHSIALKSDGTVWAWGLNYYGTLGDNTNTDRYAPVQVLGLGGSGYLTDVVAIAGGYDHSLALKSDGTVWTWGYNQYGRLGDNTVTTRYAPVQVKGVGGVGFLTDIVAIAGGGVHSLALKSDGTVWAWGSNGQGQLGDNTVTQRNAPVQVKGVGGTGWLTDATAIAAGYMHSFAIRGGSRFEIAGKDSDSGWVAGDYDPVFRQNGSGKRALLPSGIDSKRYIRYKTTIFTTDATYSPSLNEITFNYSAYPFSQTLTSSAFNTTDAADTPASIAWTESLPAGTDIKFQVRTSADGSAWSAWCGPDDGVPGSCSSATYFTDPTGTEDMDDILTDQTNDQWIQYQATLTSNGLVTPTLSDVTFTYVVNATPQIQNVVASESSDGIVTVSYEVRDPDTTTGVTQGVVDVGLQYCTANCSTPGSETWVNASTISGDVGPSVSVQEITYNSHSLTWNSQEDYPNQTNATDFKVRVTADDSEIANNIGYGASNTFAFDTDSPPEVQTVSASQGSTGTIVVNYEVKDPDTTNPLSATPGLVNVTLQYCTANCSTPGGETWADATTVADDGSVAATGAFVAKTMTWTPKTDYADQYNPTNFKVRVKVDDGEITNNLDYAESSTFILDTTDPTGVGISIDHTQSSNQLTFTTPSDDSSYQMLVSNLADFSDTTSQAFASPYTFTLTDDPATVYLRIIDAYGNYTDDFGITPARIQNLVYYDTTNAELNEYREFLAWGVVSPLQVGNGFASYDVYRSEDNVTFAKIGESTDRNINYYVDDTVVADTHYYYKVVTVDIDGNTSAFSSAVDDIPNGQGGTDSTAPTLDNLVISNIDTTSAKITWTTDELADTLVGFSSEADCVANAGVCPYLPERGLSAMILDHEITLTHLDPDTVYNIRIRSHDVVGNLGQNDKDAPGLNPIPNFTFQTLPGPAISGVTVSPNNTQAEISWVTTTDSDTYVVYSDTVTDGALVNPLEVGTPNFVGGVPAYNHAQIINTYNDAPMIPGTTYYFYVKSTDIDDNVATDDNGGAFYTLVTTQDDDPPVISNPNAAIVNDTEAAINWTTDEASTSIVNYGTTQGGPYTDISEVLTYDKSHYVILPGLDPNTDYYYTVTSSDINGNPDTSIEYSFTTLMEPAQQHPPLAALTATINEVEYDLTDLDSAAVFAPAVLTDVSSVIEFETDQIAMCDIQYRKEGQEYSPTDFIIEETGYNTDHSMHIMSLLLETKYYYKIECVDNLPEGQTGSIESVEFTFTTLEKQYGETAAEALGDSTAPVISGVSVGSVTGESVVVAWKTDEPTNSLLTYSLDGSEISKMAGNFIDSSDVTKYTTDHSVTINDLVPSSKYTLLVFCADAAGNVGQSSNSSFNTKAPSSLTAVKVSSRSLTEAVVTWETSSETSSVVEYGLTTAYGETKENSTKTKVHELAMSDLQAGQLYHFRVMGEDADGNMFDSNDNTFQQKSPPQLSGFAVSDVTERTAKIDFTTNVPTDVLVTYTDPQDENNSGVQGIPTFSTKHSIELKNLAPGREFILKIRVRDEEGNEMEEELSSFKTNSDANPPLIEQIKTDSALTQSDKVQTIISWITDEPSSSKLVYKEGMGGEEKEATVSEEFTTKNSAVFTIFKPGTVYYFKVKSIDESNNETTSQEYALLTPRRRENIIQIIIGNFEEIFSWTKR